MYAYKMTRLNKKINLCWIIFCIIIKIGILIWYFLKNKGECRRFFNDLSENRLKSAVCAGVFFSIRKHSGLRFAFDSTPKEGEYIMYLNLKYNAPFEGFWICIKLEWLYGASTRSFFIKKSTEITLSFPRKKNGILKFMKTQIHIF